MGRKEQAEEKGAIILFMFWAMSQLVGLEYLQGFEFLVAVTVPGKES